MSIASRPPQQTPKSSYQAAQFCMQFKAIVLHFISETHLNRALLGQVAGLNREENAPTCLSVFAGTGKKKCAAVASCTGFDLLAY